MSEINHELFMADAPYGIRFLNGKYAGRTGRLQGAANCFGFDAFVDGTHELVYVEPVSDYAVLTREEREDADCRLKDAQVHFPKR